MLRPLLFNSTMEIKTHMPHTTHESLSIFDLPPEATVQLDVEACAHHIELLCTKSLLPPPVGVYQFNKLEPVMLAGVPYYVYLPNAAIEKSKKADKRVCIEVFTDISTAVYNEGGEEVISAFCAKNKNGFLKEESFLPYRGLKIVELLVREQFSGLASSVYLRQRFHFLTRLQQHLTPMSTEELEEISDIVASAAREVRRDICEFTVNKEWCLYDTRSDGSRLWVNRFMDYRAFDWMQRREQGEFT